MASNRRSARIAAKRRREEEEDGSSSDDMLPRAPKRRHTIDVVAGADNDMEVDHDDNHNSSSHSFPIFVRIVTARRYQTFTFHVNVHDEIIEIARLLGEKTGVPPERISIEYRSKVLQPLQTLQFYRIGRDATLGATVRCQNNCVSFPVTVCNEKLTMRVNSIENELSKLKTSLIPKINDAKSLQDLHEVCSGLHEACSDEYHSLLQEKLECYREIDENNQLRLNSAEFELKSQKNELNESMQRIRDINQEIEEHKEKIGELEKEKAVRVVQRDSKTTQILGSKTRLEELNDECAALRETMKKMQAGMDGFDARFMLNEAICSALKGFESSFDEWSVQNVIEWFRLIEHGKFDSSKYEPVVQQLEKLEIDGSKLKDLKNDSFLSLIGLEREDRQIVLKHLDRVINRNQGQTKNLCTVCTTNRINTAFVPCGHQTCCHACYERSKRQFKTCPICRKRVTKTMKTFMNGF